MAGLFWLASYNQHLDYKTATAASIEVVAVSYHLLTNIYGGYYMAAQRYEISLRVLKNISRISAANE